MYNRNIKGVMALIEDLLGKLRTLPKRSIIMISGFGGAGKSTLATEISKHLNCTIIPADDFFRDQPEYHNWECYDYNRLIQSVLMPYIEQKTIQYEAYNWVDPSQSLLTIQKDSDYLIVEGVGLFRPSIHSMVTYSIWVQCSIEVAHHRGKQRDKQIYQVDFDKLWDTIWKQNDLENYEFEQPIRYADYIYNNE